MTRALVAVLVALCSAPSLAQTAYDSIEMGAVLTPAGIGMGLFDAIRLPPGEWLVVAKREENLPLASSHGRSRPTPQMYVTLKNNHPKDALLFAIVASFSREVYSVDWRNSECANANPKVLADNFGYKADSMLYLCAYANTFAGYRAVVAKAGQSKRALWRESIAPLAAFPGEIPDQALMVDVFGNQYKGKSIAFTFIFKAEGNIETDPAYASYVRDWMHSAGLSLARMLDNSATELALPAPYVANP